MNTLILGGGTFYHVRNHLSIAAPAFGTTARWLHQQLPNSTLVLTKMADNNSRLETNDDVENFLNTYLRDNAVDVLIMNVAMCDYDGWIEEVPSGKHAQRLKSRAGNQELQLQPSKKIIATIKQQYPSIFLVGFKTTTHHSVEQQVEAALQMGQKSQCDLVFANDTVTRYNLLVDAHQQLLSASFKRNLVLEELVNQLLIRQ